MKSYIVYVFTCKCCRSCCDGDDKSEADRSDYKELEGEEEKPQLTINDDNEGYESDDFEE
jgi:hypothetical protein